MTRLARATHWPSLWPLLCGLCLVTWLAGLALALPCGTRLAIQHWESQLDDHVSIALPSTGSTDKAGPDDSTAEKLSRALAGTFPGTNVTRLPEAEVAATLARWSAPWNGPLPVLITLRYHGDMPTLDRLVHRYAPEAAVIPPPRQMEAITPFLAHLRQSARLIAGAAGSAAALLALALLYLTARTTALANTQQLALLPRLGGTTASLHHILARRMALLAFLGSLAGLVLLLPTLVILSTALRPLLRLPPLAGDLSALLSPAIFPQPLWGPLCLLPFLMAGLGWVTVRLVGLWQDRTTP